MSQSNIKVKTWNIINAEFFPELMKIISEGQTVTIPLRGNSMRPFLEDKRDSAKLKSLEHYAVGDPILAEITPGKWVLHRIIKIDDDDIVLLGDGNLTPEYCKRQDLRAEVVGFYRKKRDRIDLITSRKWRWYSYLWMHLRPIRRILLGIYRRWIKLFGPI